jgi:hypothetical protein
MKWVYSALRFSMNMSFFQSCHSQVFKFCHIFKEFLNTSYLHHEFLLHFTYKTRTFSTFISILGS